jgi:hypothetical protein
MIPKPYTVGFTALIFLAGINHGLSFSVFDRYKPTWFDNAVRIDTHIPAIKALQDNACFNLSAQPIGERIPLF